MPKWYEFLCVLVSLTGCSAQLNDSLPLQLPPSITNSVNGACPSTTTREATRRSTQDQVGTLLRERIVPSLRSRPPCACGNPRLWRRIAHLNMSDPSQQCPTNWNLITTPVRGCGRTSTISSSCDSTIFPANGLSYSRVCGRVNAYQKSTHDAFYSSIIGSPGLEGEYIDGVSLTHGAAGSRQHIWSFVVANYEDNTIAN